MFRGLNAVAIDVKGRISIPARSRDLLKEEAEGMMVITIDPEECCLLLYSYPQWETIEKKLADLPTFNPSVRRIQRLLIGHATDVEMDRNGRLLLPPLLREYAGLDKTTMMVGQGNKFEIWGESQWRLARDAWLADGLQDDNGVVPVELSTLSL